MTELRQRIQSKITELRRQHYLAEQEERHTWDDNHSRASGMKADALHKCIEVLEELIHGQG